MSRRRSSPPDERQQSLFDQAPPAGSLVPTGSPPEPPPALAEGSGKTSLATDDPDALALAQGFARQIRRFSIERGAPVDAADLVASLALRLSLATAAGHTCLAAVEDDPALLRASGVVQWSDEPAVATTLPLVRDPGGRLYLRRYFDHEKRLAADLVARSASAAAVSSGPPPTDPSLADAQQRAVQRACGSGLTLISGGPGTGKTTTVVAILAAWLSGDPDLRVALAAPTGKAAARMLSALQARAGALPRAIGERLPSEATTLHRLLGAGRDGRFRHHAANPLPLDALVVDESSMLDVALAASLVDALPPGARLVLLGDADQLSAVDAGAVFAELVGRSSEGAVARADGPSPLAPAVARLTHSHRFGSDSPIGRLAVAINGGRAAEVQALLESGGGNGALRWIAESGDGLSERLGQAIVDGYDDYRHALLAHLRQPLPAGSGLEVFTAFDRFRVLAATRRGRRGVQAVNRLMEREARRWTGTLARQDERSPWYAGRPVLIERNEPVLRLFNGDVGICLPGEDGRLYVWFPTEQGGLRPIGPGRLPDHATAFAMTIHKSQGSEFDEVLTLLAPLDSPLNRREGVYTAVTRGRRRVTLAGDAAALAHACRTAVDRDGGLRQRLLEAAAAGLRSPASPGSR